MKNTSSSSSSSSSNNKSRSAFFPPDSGAYNPNNIDVSNRIHYSKPHGELTLDEIKRKLSRIFHGENKNLTNYIKLEQLKSKVMGLRNQGYEVYPILMDNEDIRSIYQGYYDYARTKNLIDENDEGKKFDSNKITTYQLNRYLSTFLASTTYGKREVNKHQLEFYNQPRPNKTFSDVNRATNDAIETLLGMPQKTKELDALDALKMMGDQTTTTKKRKEEEEETTTKRRKKEEEEEGVCVIL